ncbi:MAG: mtr [Friedmanniella sp.]|nr:mtr [Friedmanniella sp.]
MGRVQHFDLAIIGSGSGNSIVDERFSGLSVALVEKGVFGGTCLNVGCIPTKMYVYPADLALAPEGSSRLGVDLVRQRVRWSDIRERIFGRIDPIAAGGREWRASNADVTLFGEAAHFVGPRRLDTGSAGVITADRFVLAAGSRVRVPAIAGLDSVPYETSDTVMRLPELPGSMVILGGGFVAAEFAHVFASFGTRVSVVNRSDRLLRQEDDEVSTTFTRLLGERVDLHLSAQVNKVTAEGSGVAVEVAGADGEVRTLRADVLLVATGRVPNGDTLDLAAAGVEVDGDGYVLVDDQQRTSADGVFALGDVSSPFQLKHVANHEARVVQHNLLHPDDLVSSDHRFVPHAVFSEPQVASVGLTERQALEQGIRHVAVRQDYGSTAYGWAMEDTDHFVKLLGDPVTGQLLGAHLIGPQASSLIQPLIQAMSFGQRAHDVARGQYWIHPAMAEVVENALLQLPDPH